MYVSKTMYKIYIKNLLNLKLYQESRPRHLLVGTRPKTVTERQGTISTMYPFMTNLYDVGPGVYPKSFVTSKELSFPENIT